MGKRISELPEVTSPASTDVLPIVSGGKTKKVKVSNLAASASGSLQAANNLSDLDDAGEARTNLGLGSAATTASSAYDTAGAASAAQAASQPLDSDLTAISALTPTNDNLLQRKGGVWVDRTPAQVKTDLALVKADVGLGSADNTSDAAKPVSTAQQTALDLKVDKNGAITGATKTKVTYDAKGLVTAGADATTADIADSSNKRYVTDAQLTVIGNTSGTNTGDQNLASILASSISDGDTTHAPDGNSVFDALALKENAVNKSSDVATDIASTTKYPAVKAITDWVISLFAPKGAIGSSGLTQATNKLLGRGTASTGAVEEITLGTNLSLSGTTLNATGGGIGGSTGSTDNRILRADGAGGATVQNAALGIDDSASLVDTNGNELIKTTATASAVNEITIANAATGNSPTISATGGDSNIGISIISKGTGQILANSGSSAAPTFSFTDNPTTGIYNSAGNLVFMGQGSIQAYFSPSGTFNLYQGGNLQLNAPAQVTWFTDTALVRNAAGVVEINNGTAGNWGVLLLRGTTLSTLTSVITSPVLGMRATITDSTTVTYRATITGGGSNVVPAFYDGSNWIVS